MASSALAAGVTTFADALRARVLPAFSPGTPAYDPCHDIFHVDRVARNAAMLAREEGAEADVVVSAAYLHDLDRAGEKDPLGAARAHLGAVGAPAPFVERVLEAVERHKDKSFEKGGVRPRSLEARVLSDADKLEAIGAIGIARAFSFGGLKQRPLWDGNFYDERSVADPAAPPSGPGVVSARDRSVPHPLIEILAQQERDKLYVSGANGSTIDHFFQKLLRLQGDFATESGRLLAAERHEFLKVFLSRFFDEWYATAP